MLDVDYIDKLTPEEQAYLFAFHEAEYGGNGKILYEDIEEVRRLWRENKRQAVDAHNCARHDLPVEEISTGENTEEALAASIDAMDLAEMKVRAAATSDAREREEEVRKRKRKRLRR